MLTRTLDLLPADGFQPIRNDTCKCRGEGSNLIGQKNLDLGVAVPFEIREGVELSTALTEIARVVSPTYPPKKLVT